AAVENVRTRLLGSYPAASKDLDIDLGITLTRELPAELPLLPPTGPSPRDLCPDETTPATPGDRPTRGLFLNAQRYVTPFHARIVADAGSPLKLQLESVDAQWATRHAGIGLILPLAPQCEVLNVDNVITAVKAAKGFPVAFGPLVVPTTCPK